MRNKIPATLGAVILLTVSGCEKDGEQQEAAATAPTQAAVIADAERPARLFLQQISSNSAIIKWRGSADQACIAKASDNLSSQAQCLPAHDTESNHREVRFAKLTPDTQYHYSVGGFTDRTTRFHTAPESGQLPADGNTHIWIIGDSGSTSYEHPKDTFPFAGKSKAVMDGYLHYNSTHNNEPLDLFLMLGDNAYVDGTDDQWQKAVFEIYTGLLSQAPLWPTIGNHEMGGVDFDIPEQGIIFGSGGSTSADPNSYMSMDNRVPSRVPYLDIFTLPTKAELGGVPSGTEQYYSFNYGNVHIVSLDSQLSARDEGQRAAMKEWLIADLSSNNQHWTLVIFHHPPYSKSSHDSDTEPSMEMGIDQPIISMRQEFTPVFEDYGVDLVYSGHSHAYERSYYLNGHRGDAITFDAAKHAELNPAGEPAIGYGDEAYSQVSVGSQRDDKVVYSVAGSSGFVNLGEGKLDHPAHSVQKNDPQGRHGLEEMGSVVVDAGATELTARFINEKGQVLDTVTIVR